MGRFQKKGNCELHALFAIWRRKCLWAFHFFTGGRGGNVGAVPAGDTADQPQALSDDWLRVHRLPSSHRLCKTCSYIPSNPTPRSVWFNGLFRKCLLYVLLPPRDFASYFCPWFEGHFPQTESQGKIFPNLWIFQIFLLELELRYNGENCDRQIIPLSTNQ